VLYEVLRPGGGCVLPTTIITSTTSTTMAITTTTTLTTPAGWLSAPLRADKVTFMVKSDLGGEKERITFLSKEG